MPTKLGPRNTDPKTLCAPSTARAASDGRSRASLLPRSSPVSLSEHDGSKMRSGSCVTVRSC
jgi:hypothetical protein